MHAVECMAGRLVCPSREGGRAHLNRRGLVSKRGRAAKRFSRPSRRPSLFHSAGGVVERSQPDSLNESYPCTALIMSNIGMYIATTIPPITTPITTIMMGSSTEVSADTAASTSSS